MNRSKQQRARDEQCYTPKAIPRECSTCLSFTFKMVQIRKPDHWIPGGVFAKKKLRCSIGGFAVKKTGVCDLYLFNTELEQKK